MNNLSVYGLIKKLVEEKARILMDPELVGSYSRISNNKKRVDIDRVEWGVISGIVGNSFRANLNISVDYDVTVTVPKNDYGIKEGEKRNTELRINFNIIKGGELNIEKLAVIVSPDLLKKIEDSESVRMNLIYKNSILIDLTKLPIIVKEEIGLNYVEELGRCELKNYIYRANKKMIRMIGNSHESPYTEEEYLRTLAYKEFSVEAIVEKNSYKSRELKVYTNGFIVPSVLSSYLYSYLNYGKTNEPSMDKFLNTLDKNETIDSLNKKLRENTIKSRDVKFRLLMCKKPLKNNIIVKLPGSNKEVKIGWKIIEK